MCWWKKNLQLISLYGASATATVELWQFCIPDSVTTNQQTALDCIQATIIQRPGCGFYSNGALIDSLSNLHALRTAGPSAIVFNIPPMPGLLAPYSSGYLDAVATCSAAQHGSFVWTHGMYIDFSPWLCIIRFSLFIVDSVQSQAGRRLCLVVHPWLSLISSLQASA